MAATASIRVVKTFPGRGGTMTFSNRYHVTGPDFSGQTQFDTFADLIVADEKLC